MEYIYLDNAASTPVDKEFGDIVSKYNESCFYNPSGITSASSLVRRDIEHARQVIADSIGAEDKDQIVFTSGATEGNNMVYNDDHMSLCSAIEHSSIYNLHRGKEMYWSPDGVVREVEFFAKNKSNGSDFPIDVILMVVNNETGMNYLDYIRKIASVKVPNMKLITDATQAIGKVNINVTDDGIDYLTMSGHKIYAPKGTGFVYMKEPKLPLLIGGEQENGRRAGTENVGGIIALSKAVQNAVNNIEQTREHNIMLCRTFLEALSDTSAEFSVNGTPDTGVGILNIRFPGVMGESLVLASDANKIIVSSGSACNANNMFPSRVLKALGLSDEEALSSVRVSFSKHNTAEEVKFAASQIGELAKELKR